MSFEAPDYERLVDSFAAGYLDTPESDGLPPGATPDARNCLFERIQVDGRQRATLRKRTGDRLLNPTAISLGDPIDAMHEFTREGNDPKLLAVCDGTLYAHDDATSFTAITGGTFSAGAATRLLNHKNNAVVMDGVSAPLRYDGTNLKAMGFSAPGAAPTLAAQGTGLTGTYRGFAVWYDSTTDHESSPSAYATALALTNQGRRWGRPASPPATADYWRIYVQRTDTNEAQFYRVATVAIATTTYDEAVTDENRRDLAQTANALGPVSNSNDAPSAFAMMAVYRGFGIAFTLDSSIMHVSRQNDLQSWSPKDRFPIDRGAGKAVRSVHKLKRDETEICLIQKPTKTYWLQGNRVPFDIDELHPTFGNVNQEAAVATASRFYAWDEVRGPYWTDTREWKPLADARVRTIVASLNKAQLSGIRCAYHPTMNVVLWAVPMNPATRRRLLLPYHEVLDCWLPPIDGLEYASLCTWTPNNGSEHEGIPSVYVGDYWGRVYELFSGDAVGVPSGTVSAAITAATSSTVTASGATFYTSGDGLAGMPVAVISPAGVWQWRRVQSNTATQIVLDTTNDAPFSTTPASSGWTVVVGGIRWYWQSGWDTLGSSARKKKGTFLMVQAKAASESHELTALLRFNDGLDVSRTITLTFEPGTLSGIWGVAIWGQSYWGSAARKWVKRRIHRAFSNVRIEFSNYYPNQPFEVAAYQLEADAMPRRRAA